MRRTSLALVLLVAATACAVDAGDRNAARPVRNDSGRTATPTPSVTGTPTDGPREVHGLRFAVLGDFGSGLEPQYAVARRMCRWRRDHPYNLIVTTGDNVYPDGSREYFDDAFFEPYSCLLDNGARFRATLGNHDIVTDNGRPELNEPAFGLKARNYLILRAGVRLVMVNSNALNRRWLRRALRSEPGERWTIVVMHHPIYSSGEHGSTSGLGDLPALFRRKGVDLVLSGHDHDYEVTRPLRKIRYAVTGGGGASLRSCNPQWFSQRCIVRHHFLYVRAGLERIKVAAVPARGRVLDRFATTGRR